MNMTDLKQLIQIAFEEDVGEGDITTEAIVSSDQKGRAEIRAKQNLVVAGLEIGKQVFRDLDSKIAWEHRAIEGECVPAGTVVATIFGSLATLLKGERVALNFLQRLSGIATLTHQFVAAVAGTNAVILDTRKTTPGWRALEKFAVRVGGGNNHRFGLFDRYLIKNNHIAAAGSIQKAIEKVLEKRKGDFLVEVEVRNLEELKQALAFPIDVILLDNFSFQDIEQAVQLTQKKVKLEVCGGVTLETVARTAATGVDFISIGALTHSAPAADLHMIIL